MRVNINIYEAAQNQMIANSLAADKKKKRHNSSSVGVSPDAGECMLSEGLHEILNLMSDVASEIRNHPGSSKLNQIKKLVKNGRFFVDCEKLACDMIALA